VRSETNKLIEKVLKLPPEAHAAIAGSLLESLDETVDEDTEASWADEIARRVRDLDAGKAKTILWSQARRMILGG
jgi:putative addiction module component (TIGR02574 family)